MARTILYPQRLTEVKRTTVGHIIIFCEGKTEKHYFDYFAGIIKKNKYTSIEVVIETVGGDAQTVLDFANTYLLNEDNNQAYGTYGKYIAFDCDAPPDIQAVILGSQDYGLLISNYLFETWLLMHFEEVDIKLTKRQAYRILIVNMNTAHQNIDNKILVINKAICRHIDSLYISGRGVASQDILVQLRNFVEHIMLKIYSNGQDIDTNLQTSTMYHEYIKFLIFFCCCSFCHYFMIL